MPRDAESTHLTSRRVVNLKREVVTSRGAFERPSVTCTGRTCRPDSRGSTMKHWRSNEHGSSRRATAMMSGPRDVVNQLTTNGRVDHRGRRVNALKPSPYLGRTKPKRWASTSGRMQQSSSWSFTSPVACMNAHTVVGPTNFHPRAFRSFANAIERDAA